MIMSMDSLYNDKIMSLNKIDRRYVSQSEKVCRNKPSQNKKKHNFIGFGYDCASDEMKTGWNRSEVPEFKSIAPRDNNLPEINTSLYIDSLTLW